MATIDNEVSLANPTREFLSSYRKIELQKHCQEIGITKVWVTKEELIELILEKKNVTREGSPEENGQETDQQMATDEVKEMREKIDNQKTEIEDLNEHLKAAHVMINKLSDRLSTLEEQVKSLQRSDTDTFRSNSANSQTTPFNTPTERTLLLGDGNLNYARSSDLDSKCYIRTIKEANINLIRCWVAEKLSWVPSTCILYCGFQDIFEKCCISDIFDKLGNLVTCLKQLNNNMNVQICELAPALNVHEFDEKINHFNAKLAEWSEINGTTVIKTNLPFRLGTGEVDQMCFQTDSENNINYLNRFGIIRLLNIISNQSSSFNLHENWDNIMSYATSDLKRISNRQGRGRLNPNLATAAWQDIDNTEEHYGYRRDNPGRSYHRHISDGNPVPTSFNPTSRDPRGLHHRSDVTNRRSYQYQQNQPRFKRPTYPTQRRICQKCGESNHVTSDCRHEHKIKCNICQELGHKTRLCHNRE